jgi:hypothetical protein
MLDIVIFSNDRACQLDLLLRSIKRFFSEWREANIQVLYTASSRRFDRAYNEVRAEHREFRYVCELDHEASFRELTVGLLEEGSELMFLRSDDVLTESFSLKSAELVPLIERRTFHDRDSFEAALAGRPLPSPCATRVEESIVINLPIATGEWLNDQYLDGRRLSLETVAGVRNSPPHREIPLMWDEPAPHTGGDRPRVSVVIPCFNCGPYLEQTVDSVLEQTLDGIEVIIVDDGSTDDSVAVARRLIEEHPGASIRLLEQRNSGHPGYTRNTGVLRAGAEYVLCLDADDMLAPTFLETSVGALDAHPDAGFAYTDQQHFGAVNTSVPVLDYDFRTLTRLNIVGVASVFRRSVWEEVGWFETHRRYEDWDFWIACGALGRYGVKAHGTHWCYRVRTDGRFATGGAPRDRLNKAQIVARRPGLYTEAQRAWAAAVLADDPLVATVADQPGVIPELTAFPPIAVHGAGAEASAANRSGSMTSSAALAAARAVARQTGAPILPVERKLPADLDGSILLVDQALVQRF